MSGRVVDRMAHLRERGSVVHAIAHKSDSAARSLQVVHHLQLACREHSSDDLIPRYSSCVSEAESSTLVVP